MSPHEFANDIINCWTVTNVPSEALVIGTADKMGLYADLRECPPEMHDEILDLVREGFEAYNAEHFANTSEDMQP